MTPGLGRSPGEGKGHPLQCSGLENSMDCIVHGVANSQTRVSDFHKKFTKGMNRDKFPCWKPLAGGFEIGLKGSSLAEVGASALASQKPAESDG